jgi:hypothetical protein
LLRHPRRIVQKPPKNSAYFDAPSANVVVNLVQMN